jgi:hypothetical protein
VEDRSLLKLPRGTDHNSEMVSGRILMLGRPKGADHTSEISKKELFCKDDQNKLMTFSEILRLSTF